MKITHCRSCGGSRLQIILNLGDHPVSNALLTKDEIDNPEERFPLAIVFCRDCTLLQVNETVPAEVLYRAEYPYFSSSSPALLQHAAEIAENLIADRKLGRNSLVVEIASNDGYLLKNFVKHGIPCLGIDPAKGPADYANSVGVPTLNKFFNSAMAKKMAEKEGLLADVIIANNVVAHVDAINDFVAGFASILKPAGIAVFEFAYAVDLIQNCEFDTMYHEHLFYHTLHGLTPLFARHGLYLNDVKRLPIHGGSLRLFVSRDRKKSRALMELLRHEKALGVDQSAWYETFADRVSSLRDSLVALLRAEKARGKRIACYGAAAKGSTMINFLNLGPGFFDFVADANPHKQGKYMPGQRIPISHPDRIAADRPDFVLLLVWNFAGEVLRQQSAYRQAGGRFIIPIPVPRIVEPDETTGESPYALGHRDPAARVKSVAPSDVLNP